LSIAFVLFFCRLIVLGRVTQRHHITFLLFVRENGVKQPRAIREAFNFPFDYWRFGAPRCLGRFGDRAGKLKKTLGANRPLAASPAPNR
jgi:hypothetical protein